MDIRRIAPYVKMVLFFVEFYFLYASFRLVLYSSENVYYILHDNGVTDYNACLRGDESACLAGLKYSAAFRKCLLETNNPGKTIDLLGLDNGIEQGKHNGKRIMDEENNPRGSRREHAKAREQGDRQIKTRGPKELSTDLLKQSLDEITDIMNELVQNDPDTGRSVKARQGVMEAVSCYKKLLAQKTKKGPSAYDILISKIRKGPKEEEDDRKRKKEF